MEDISYSNSPPVTQKGISILDFVLRMTKTTPFPPCPLTLLFSVYSISICKFVEGPVQIATRRYLSLLTAMICDL